MAEHVRWGVLGVAGITAATIPGILGARNAQLAGIASRRAGVAATAVQRWGSGRPFDGYQALLDDPDVDVVYVPLPNDLHAEWTVKALDAGKHVLCEKPLALSLADVLRIKDASERNGRFVLEAFMYRFAPRWVRALELLRAGAIGEPRAVRLGLAFKQFYPDYNIRFDRDAGGGVLWDMGVYGVDMARGLFADEPQAATATSWTRPGESVETSVQAILDFPAGRSALMHVSFDYGNPYSQVEVVGSDGWIALPGTGMRREPFTALLLHQGETEVFTDGREPAVERFADCDTYRLEVEHLSDCVQTGRPPQFPIDHAVANTRVIAALQRAIASGSTVPLR